jgi:hypothetical protein
MMYDQGFVIETNTKRYYTNFKYELKPENMEVNKLRLATHTAYANFNSICYSTMVGHIMYKLEPGTFTCFFGNKLGPKIIQTPE